MCKEAQVVRHADHSREERGKEKTLREAAFLRALMLSLGLCLMPSHSASAQGGPPFRTDDPETPGNRHWEINVGFIGQRSSSSGQYQVPDFDVNYGLGERIQLKYEIPLAVEETRPSSTLDRVARPIPGQVIGGLGESLLGIKWRFYERHTGDVAMKGQFGTGLLGALRHLPNSAEASGDSPGAEDTPEQKVTLSVSTYPQLFLDKPTRAIPRGLVASGPQFYLRVELNAHLGLLRLDGEVGYNFGSHAVPQSWGRGLIIGHEFSDRSEAYAELYDKQDAN